MEYLDTLSRVNHLPVTINLSEPCGTRSTPLREEVQTICNSSRFQKISLLDSNASESTIFLKLVISHSPKVTYLSLPTLRSTTTSTSSRSTASRLNPLLIAKLFCIFTKNLDQSTNSLMSWMECLHLSYMTAIKGRLLLEEIQLVWDLFSMVKIPRGTMHSLLRPKHSSTFAMDLPSNLSSLVTSGVHKLNSLQNGTIQDTT